MKNKTLAGVASFFLSLSVIILIALMFFGDRIDSMDTLLNNTTTQISTAVETTTELTTVRETEPVTETTTEAENTTLTEIVRPAYSGSDEKLVAFTFDDGPSPAITPRILDILEMYGARATFFVLGSTAQGKEYIFERMKSLGCQIGNHSQSHRNFENMSDDEIRADFEQSQEAIRNASGITPEVFRVPYGDNTAKIRSNIDLPIVYWSIDTLDWAKKDKPNVYRSEEERNEAINNIHDGVVNYVQPGDIVLMHDLYEITVDAFEKIMCTLSDDGWEMVTVSELYEIRGYELKAGSATRCAR